MKEGYLALSMAENSSQVLLKRWRGFLRRAFKTIRSTVGEIFEEDVRKGGGSV